MSSLPSISRRISSAQSCCRRLMRLLGDLNRCVPKWLEWLPQLEHEAPKAPPVLSP